MLENQFGAFEREPADRLQQHVREARYQQPELIRPPTVATGAVGKQIQLLLLDAVIHVPSGATDPLIQPPGRAAIDP